MVWLHWWRKVQEPHLYPVGVQHGLYPEYYDHLHHSNGYISTAVVHFNSKIIATDWLWRGTLECSLAWDRPLHISPYPPEITETTVNHFTTIAPRSKLIQYVHTYRFFREVVDVDEGMWDLSQFFCRQPTQSHTCIYMHQNAYNKHSTAKSM